MDYIVFFLMISFSIFIYLGSLLIITSNFFTRGKNDKFKFYSGRLWLFHLILLFMFLLRFFNWQKLFDSGWFQW